MSTAIIVYAPRPDATPEGEIDALAAVYAFLIRARATKKAVAGPDGEEDARKGDIHVRAKLSIP